MCDYAFISQKVVAIILTDLKCLRLYCNMIIVVLCNVFSVEMSNTKCIHTKI